MKYLWKLKQKKETDIVEEGTETVSMDAEAVDTTERTAEAVEEAAVTNKEENTADISPEAKVNSVKIPVSNKPLSIGSWYITFMCMSVPIIGWIYLLFIAFTDKDPGRKQFARAWILYKLTILVACITLIAVSVHMLIPYMEQLLNYMEAL